MTGGSAPERNFDVSKSCFLATFFKSRILGFFWSDPPVFGFILSLLFIAASLAILGVHIKGGDMPDLDAMKVSYASMVFYSYYEVA